MKISLTFLGAAVVALAAAAPALAEYPERPVTLLVPFTAGGGSDMGARTYEPYLEECLGQDVVIVNKPGAGGELGFAELAQTTPDGYTIGDPTTCRTWRPAPSPRTRPGRSTASTTSAT